ncbi:alpha/beta fold hydrolase [Litoribrevibacter euphylliae]|uniref:Alpha/beta fold hydrolase n=1 Tax=Litoribrevibacter euphylliae TaxID=1834034 RepID=A0ABV7HFS2_9GAMM
MNVQIKDGYIYTKALGEENKGIPLLIIHGGPDWDHTYLLPAANRLSKTRRVILFDLRGCGRSSKFDAANAYSMSNVLSDIKCVLSAYNISTCDILGFSFGGVISIHLLKNTPHQVNKLILASTTAFNDFQEELELNNDYQERCTPELQEFISQAFKVFPITKDEPSKSLALKSIALDVYDLSKLNKIKDIISKITFSTEWLNAHRAGKMAAPKLSAPETIKASGKDVLILHGAKDLRFPLSVARRLHKRLETSELAIIENAGHLAHLESPALWVNKINKFLS